MGRKKLRWRSRRKVSVTCNGGEERKREKSRAVKLVIIKNIYKTQIILRGRFVNRLYKFLIYLKKITSGHKVFNVLIKVFLINVISGL